MAIKVIGVDGERLLPDDAGGNQDFLLVNIPILSFGTIGKYRQLIGLLEKNAENPAFLQRAMAGVARGVETAVEAVGVEPGPRCAGSRATTIICSARPITRWRRSASAITSPRSAPRRYPTMSALTGKDVDTVEDSPCAISWSSISATQGAEYQLRAQLCADLDKMPVEDAAVLWPEELSPHQPIATLRIPPQDAYSPARRVYGDDVLSFNPWHGIREHQPLGSIMRVRIAAYERSTRYRHEMNAQPRVEPTTIDAIRTDA
jgi:hypothetical protein